MSFILNLARREMRSSWQRLIFFFLCIAIGTGSIVALRSLLQNLKASVNKESRALLTADVQVAANAPFDEKSQQILKRFYGLPFVTDHTQMLETATMIRPVKDQTAVPKMVELKAVQAQFPFYGQLALNSGTPYSHDLLKGRGALVRQAVLTSFNLNVGDQILINDQPFTIRGVIEKEPGNTLNAFSFGPRVLIDYADAANVGLLGFGSRARYRVLFKTRDGFAGDLSAQLKLAFQNQPLVSVRSYRYSQDRLSNSLTQVEDFLSLIGLVILVLGGIGISSVTRVFINQKMKTIAILKTLGSNNRRVLAAYLLQVLLLGLFGSLLGLALAKLTLLALPYYFGGPATKLPLDIEFNLTWSAVWQGLGIGLLISLLFSLVPLLEIRRIKPILVLRSGAGLEEGHLSWWRDPMRIIVSALVAAGLLALAGWQAGSLKIGALFLAGLAAMTLVLNLAAWLLMRGLRGLRHLPSFALRQGVNSLYRPGNQTRIILLAVGLGVFFVVAVRLLQVNLLDEFNVDLNNNARADLYLVDIQRDQLGGLGAFIKQATGEAPPLIPTIRSRIAQINGREVNPDRAAVSDNRGLLGREYVLTYRPQLDASETIIAGRFWDSTPGSEAEISIEELLHKELGLNLNDHVTFDILGKQITARVTNIRRVDWRNARTGFLVVFRPGPLDNAPTMYVSALKGPKPGVERAQFQRDLVDRFPNVSVIDVYDIIEVARGIVGNVSLAVTFVGGFVFLSGLLILVGSIAMTKFHRLYESAILKTLGAKRKLIVATLLVEYGVLGLLAGALGSSAAIALTWAVSKYGLEITWRFVPSVNLLGVALALVLVMAVGVVSSWDVLVKKPLGILRSE
ncbi:MAG: FtsX-like permease family protein [Acidobacteria bacterium]|nr:FtsX-like permease family protein [Acidobacteriota bacterium]MBI3422605.1 FtsX-like permease family protein [Acidobacteriota bacterium]